MSDKKRGQEPPPRQSYIPRPPSQADIDLVSGQQGMIEDEWTGEPMDPHENEEPAESKTEQQPS